MRGLVYLLMLALVVIIGIGYYTVNTGFEYSVIQLLSATPLILCFIAFEIIGVADN